MSRSRRKLWVGIGLVFVFVLLAVFLCTGETGRMLRELVITHSADDDWAEIFDFGREGMLGIALLSLFQVILLFIPAEPIQVLAGLSYGFGWGVVLCMAGVLVANTLIYVLYKIYGERLDHFFTKRIHIDFESARHHGRVATIVFLLYFLPAIPYGMICLFASAMRMRYPRYILVTSIGVLPSVCIGVGLGYVATEISWILSLGVFAILVIALCLVYVRRDRAFAWINRMIERDSDVSKTEVKPARPLLWHLLLGGCRLFFSPRVKVRIKSEVERVKGPAIVLCNHGAFIDFYYAGLALKRERPHFMTARLYFFRRDLGWLLRSLGSFPKSMFSPDFENAKNCRRVLRNGGILAMMPEARLSTAGTFEDIQPDTYRFIHKAGVDVYVCHINGDYLASPKWGDGLRRGSLVEVELSRLMTAEEAAALSEAEVIARVDEALYYDDFAWIKNHPEVSYASKTLAEGLENVLTRCPRCGGRHTLVTHGRTLSCSACIMRVEMDSRYGFDGEAPFANLQEWYRWQEAEMRREILADPDFEMTAPVKLHHASVDGKRCLRPAGQGTCTLNREGLTYRGTEDGAEVEKHFPIKTLYRILFGAGEDFEVYEGKQIWYFVPEEKRSCVDYYTASVFLKELSEKKTEVSV